MFCFHLIDVHNETFVVNDQILAMPNMPQSKEQDVDISHASIVETFDNRRSCQQQVLMSGLKYIPPLHSEGKPHRNDF